MKWNTSRYTQLNLAGPPTFSASFTILLNLFQELLQMHQPTLQCQETSRKINRRSGNSHRHIWRTSSPLCVFAHPLADASAIPYEENKDSNKQCIRIGTTTRTTTITAATEYGDHRCWSCYGKPSRVVGRHCSIAC